MTSDRSASESRLNESLHELRLHAAALEAVADPLVLTDPGGVILWVNPAFTRQNGWRLDEVLGKTPRVLKSGKTDPELYERLWKAAVGGGSWSGAVVNRRKDGTEYIAVLTVAPVLGPEGRPEAFVATYRDVSAQRVFEEELRRSERSLRAIVHQIPEAITIHRDGRFVYVNPKTVEYLGYRAPEDLIGHSVLDIVHPDDRSVVAARMRSGAAGAPLEERFLRVDGAIVVAEVVGLPIEFEGAPALLAVARDVTQTKVLRARMMQLDRAIAVGTLAAGVAHEINNPLAFVTANLEFVAQALKGVPASILPNVMELREVLAEASDGAERIRRIVKDLKLFSRAESDARELVELEPVIESSVKLSWNEIRHRARLEKSYAATPRIAGNAGRLGQLFVNLLLNAAQAIPEGQVEKSAISIKTFTDDLGQAVVEIRDTGSGIRPEILPRIFDPFFTTKPVGQGTGLGLSVCREIVVALGGTIGVESEVGRGTRFRIGFPPVDSAVRGATEPVEAAPTALAAQSRGLRILVVDDEPMVGRALARVLADHETVVTTSAKEAFERIERGERFDAIICDLMMPAMSGMEFHARLSKLDPELASRMIFLTGGAFTSAAAEFLERVPNQRLDKPVRGVDLERTIGAALGTRER